MNTAKSSNIMQPHSTRITSTQTHLPTEPGSLPDASGPQACSANLPLLHKWGCQIALLAVILGGLLQTAQAQAVRIDVYAMVTGYGKVRIDPTLVTGKSIVLVNGQYTSGAVARNESLSLSAQVSEANYGLDSVESFGTSTKILKSWPRFLVDNILSSWVSNYSTTAKVTTKTTTTQLTWRAKAGYTVDPNGKAPANYTTTATLTAPIVATR